MAERIAQLQEALLHCGKFQDALEPLLSWLSDTEELVANQKPPSAEYRVVKAQIQEQKVGDALTFKWQAVFHLLFPQNFITVWVFCEIRIYSMYTYIHTSMYSNLYTTFILYFCDAQQ